MVVNRTVSGQHRFLWVCPVEAQRESLADLQQAGLSIFEYIESFFHNIRTLQTLNYQSPNQIEKSRPPKLAL